MKIRRIAGTILVLFMCFGYFGYSIDVRATSDDQADVKVQEICRLGIFGELPTDLSASVTRAEMVKYVIDLLGQPELAEGNAVMSFSDVSKEHWASGYVKFALESGMIAGNSSNIFEPDKEIVYEQALKMLIKALGYDDYAQIKGSYPTGYIIVANKIGLIRNVDAQIGKVLSQKNAFVLLRNALTVPLPATKVSILPSGEVNIDFSMTNDGDNLLYKIYGVSIYNVKITDVKSSSGEIRADILSVKGKQENRELNIGKSALLKLSEKMGVGDYKFTFAEIWVDKNNIVLNVTVDSDIKIINGYIDEVNKQHEKGSKHDPRDISSIALLDSENYIDVAADCGFYYNNAMIESGGIPLIGAYSRIVLNKDEIIVVEAWSLKEGGIISEVGEDSIEYSRAERKGLKIDEIGSYKDLTILINGEKTELWSFIPDIMFDYYADEDKNCLMIIASTRTITDTLTSLSSEYAYFGEIQYSISGDYPLYSSINGATYNISNDAYDLIGTTVTAYLDYAGFVRYIKTAFFDEENSEFYGLVTGFQNGKLGNDKMYVYHIYKNSVQGKLYEIYNKLTLSDGITINSIKNDIQTIQNVGERDVNTAIKNANLLYKFHVNKKKQIISIRRANLFDLCPETGITSLTGFSSVAYPYIPTPRIYFDGAAICALYYDGDKITAKMLLWSDLQTRICSGIRLDFYCEENSSDIELLIVRGNVETIAQGRDEFIKYGLVTKRSSILDSETGEELVKLNVDGRTYKLSKENAENIKNDTYIIYGEDVSLSNKNEISIIQFYRLSDDPSTWTVVGGTTEGLHKGDVQRIDNRRICFADGSKFYMASGLTFYKIMSNGKIEKCEKSDVYEGAQMWYLYYYSEIRAVFFK